MPAAEEYASSDMRVWQVWISANQLTENEPFTLTIDYSNTLMTAADETLSFTFHKQEASSGKHSIDPAGDTEHPVDVAERFSLSVPETPEKEEG